VLRSSGAVTGGKAESGAGAGAGREREWRELPNRLAEIVRRRQGIESALDEALALEKQVRDEAATWR